MNTITRISGYVLTMLLLAGCAASTRATSGETSREAEGGLTADEASERIAELEAQLAEAESEDEFDPTVDEGEVGITDNDDAPYSQQAETYDADERFSISGASWESQGFEIKITELFFSDVNTVCPDGVNSAGSACWDVEDTPWKTIVAATILVTNDTGKTVDAFPDQATLVIGPDQVDASMDGPSVGGTFYDGVVTEGQGTWKFPRNVDRLVDIGKARLIMSSPTWAADWEPITSAYDDVDLTITW